MKDSVCSGLRLSERNSPVEPRNEVHPPDAITCFQRRMVSSNVPVQILSDLRTE